MKSEFLIAITQLAAERNLPKEVVLEAVQAALASAYKKDAQAENQNIAVRILPTSGEIKVYVLRTVVETVADAQKETTLAAARKLKPNAKMGDTMEQELPFHHAGRIAAQTAKQVVLQRLREAERDLLHAEYAQKQGEILSGVILRVDPRSVTVDLSRTEGALPPAEQVPTERYRPGERMKFFVLEVSKAPKGPQVILSRTHKNMIRRLFELEVPEIANGVVEIKAIAREPGLRTKVAVTARQQGVDPVGSCVGLRGIRIQNIVNELRGEKIDVVEWHRTVAVFIAKALSPAQVLGVELNEAENTARVVVPDRQLSLAIGKEGQNARLAAKLTGWRIDIKGATEAEAERVQRAAARAAAQAEAVAVAEAVPSAEGLPAPVAAPIAAPEPVPAVPMPAVAEAAPAPIAAAPEAVPAEAGEEEPAPAAPAPAPELPPEEIVWKLPEVPVAEKAPIRFAEDILGERGRAKAVDKGREEEKAKAKKPKKARKPRGGEEEEELLP